MRKLCVILIAVVTLYQPSLAFACSCVHTRSMSQIVEGGAIVVLASPVGELETNEFLDLYLHPKRLRIWKTYSGETAPFEDIYTSSNTSCVITLPENETSLIIATRGKSKTLRTSLCADGGYSKDQWITYFETGKETPPRDMCYMQIKQAYDAEIFVGEFKLERPECAVHIPDYDRNYRRTKSFTPR